MSVPMRDDTAGCRNGSNGYRVAIYLPRASRVNVTATMRIYLGGLERARARARLIIIANRSCDVHALTNVTGTRPRGHYRARRSPVSKRIFALVRSPITRARARARRWKLRAMNYADTRYTGVISIAR